MTVYKVYHIKRGMIMQCTNHDDAMAYVNRNGYEIYSIYCGGAEVVVIEVL